jgi:NAD(P)-dependent dehydrogenase (short-subunit alcohol dehydrogenase family)
MNQPITNWSGKVVWLLGASSGIGRATAELLHAKGATVVVSARNQAALDTFVATRPGSMALALDVTDAEQVAAVAQTILARHHRFDLVMYCVGHYKPHTALNFDLVDMRRHMDINYTGALAMLNAVLPPLLAQGAGHISVVSSVAAYRGLPKALAYGPTKAALVNLAEVLYLDLHRKGIGVSLINPGFVATPLTAANDFQMPALITPEVAADHILRGWSKGHFEIHFPKRFTLWLKLLRILPNDWYIWAVQRAAL